MLREHRLLRAGHAVVVGVDEVGRGAWAGPVVVGAVAVDARTGSAPEGLKDSKALAPRSRERLAPLIESWCVASSVGAATPGEIDELGIVGALGVAATRALECLGVETGAVLLDGGHDYLSPHRERAGLRGRHLVVTVVRGDRECASVAAASVLAKVRRDAQMVELGAEEATYGFESHKGYGTAQHAAAIAAHGLTSHHRASWTFARPRDAQALKEAVN